MWKYDNSYNELYHYGIPGMKWGVRKKRYEAKYAKLRDKMNQLRETKGVGSNEFRKAAKNRYIVRQQIKYADAKDRKDETDAYHAKRDVRFAKSVRRSGMGSMYFDSAIREVFGKNLTNKEVSTIKMKEDKMINAKEKLKRIMSTVGPITASAALIYLGKSGATIRLGKTTYKFK